MSAASDTSTDHLQQRSNRRSLLRLAGAAAAGGAAASILHAAGASAATGAMQYGATNTAGASETTLTSGATATLIVDNTSQQTGVFANSTGAGTGVIGKVTSPASDAFGVWGLMGGDLGYGLAATNGQAQLFLDPAGARGPSLAGYHRQGEVAFDGATQSMWVCVVTGTPGTWRKLAGPTTAGSFHAISPARVYDSRKPSANPLATGFNRPVTVAHSIDLTTGASQNDNVVPAGATAISFTVTVVNTVGSNGYLTVNEGGNTTVKASTINWSAPGVTLANSSVVKINSNRQVTVICGGTSTSTNFIIDVVGYYL